MNSQPLAIDLFCGLGGWTEGLLAEGYRVVGFDIERHVYGAHRYPAQLVLQDVQTIHGRQFKDAALIVASPPCQEYSYMAMPWSLAKQKIRDYEAGVRDVKQLTALFDACFRIQQEAIAATRKECHCNGHMGDGWDKDRCWCCHGSGYCPGTERHIPLVVENVRGAQRWVGRARWNFGSFYLWGDVPALMPMTRKAVKVPTMGAGWYPPGHPKHVPGLSFNGHAARLGRRTDVGNGTRFTSRDCGIEAEGVKQRGSGREWFAGEGKISRVTSSNSPARKHASAMIAKIPLTLSRHIAASWHPREAA